jgi:hypothetical protein
MIRKYIKSKVYVNLLAYGREIRLQGRVLIRIKKKEEKRRGAMQHRIRFSSYVILHIKRGVESEGAPTGKSGALLRSPSECVYDVPLSESVY